MLIFPRVWPKHFSDHLIHHCLCLVCRHCRHADNDIQIYAASYRDGTLDADRQTHTHTHTHTHTEISGVAKEGGSGRPPPLTSVVNANVCSKTNKIYTYYMHFQSFFMSKSVWFAHGAPTWTLPGELLALPHSLAGGWGGLLPLPNIPIPTLGFQPRFSPLQASVRPPNSG